MPARLARIAPSLAAALANGFELSVVPLVGALLPPVTILIGLWLGWVPTGYNPGGALHYLYSLLTMVIFVIISQHGAALGAYLWLGYAAGDFAYYLAHGANGAVLATRLLADTVLLALVVVIPLATSTLSRGIERTLASRRAAPALAGIAGLAARAVIAYTLVYLWSAAAAPLLQGVYVWSGNTPATHGLVQAWLFLSPILGLVAAYVAASRGLLERLAAPGLVERRARLRAAVGALPADSFARRLALIPLRALLLTFVLGSMFLSWADALRLLVIIAVVLLLRELVTRLAPQWTRRLTRIPTFARAFAVFLIVAFGEQMLVTAVPASSGFLLTQVALVFGLIVSAIAMPARRTKVAA